ncbi:MAG: aldehyde dehydrogenase [Solirubrobacterales bacterium]|nr:aldehyde dehydrogenase [Solirubrobacterales bacterium]
MTQTADQQRLEHRDFGRDVLHVIDGEAVPSADGRTFESVDPHTGRVWARVAEGGAEDVRRAVAAARRAFDEGPWPRMSADERGKLMHALADAVHDRREEIAQAETRDMGKPITESRTFDLPRVERNLRFFADWLRMSEAEVFPATKHLTYSRYEPKGVVTAISPWNFPLMLGSWKIAPALAFGNTAILKPAEQSPVTATMLGELAAEVLPPGVLNVVQGFGPDAAGEYLVASPDVDLVTFTGESTTGKAIMANAAPTLKGLSLELGGKSPNIVFADADLDLAVAGTLKGIFKNQGEVCLAGSRLLLERPIYDEFMERLIAGAKALPIGDPLDPATQIGPMVTAEHRDRVVGFLESGTADGAVRLGGGVPSDPALADGFYVEPTIIEGLPADHRCVRDEIFGPALVVSPFDGEAEALERANDTPYGLAAMVWTTNLSRAHRVAASVRAGLVWVNCFFVRDLRTPFGGAKLSGVGREGGVHSRDFFTEAKTVTVELDGM